MEEAELCFPHLQNFSCRKTMLPRSVSIFTHIMLISMSVFTVTLNLLVIISISHFKQLHSPTNLLVLSLAVSDFFVGFILLYQTVLIDGCWFLGDVLCVLCHVLAYTICSASIGTMVLISVDRYVAICDPLHYQNKIAPKRVKIGVCLCWMFSALFHTVLQKDYLEKPDRYNSCIGQCVIVVSYVAGLVDMFVSFIGPVTVIVVLYMRVFMVIVSQARAMRLHIAAVSVNCSAKVTPKKSEIKAAITLGVVVVVFLICVSPYFCIALTGQDTILSVTSFTLIAGLFSLNSCLNPVIYAFFYSWFRKSIKLIVTLKILQTDSCDFQLAVEKCDIQKKTKQKFLMSVDNVV